ncbi:MAG: hypothetical protein HZB98_09630, partial [Bacteroidia bacterium]|nr:hypothetical protein [Bacteroidia bacterium]
FSSPADLRNATINTARGDNGIDTDAGIGTFSINNNAASGFTMSGGTISVHDVCNTSATPLAFLANPPSSNINISGGTVQILPTSGTIAADANYYINTTVPVYNMVINRASSTSDVHLTGTPLVVQRNLSFTSASVFANNLDITIGGNFTIDAASTYTTGTNSTIFNGTADQTFSVSTAAPLSLYKLTINTASGIGLFYSGTQSVINVTNDFRLVSGTLNDNGNTTNIGGNVYNSGTITGTGRILLNGTGLQSFDGDGIYNNIELLNTNAAAAPVSLLADMTINGILTLSNDKIFNINTFNVTLNSSATILGASSTRYLSTSGNTGDGGLTKVYSSPAAFTFPLGV